MVSEEFDLFIFLILLPPQFWEENTVVTMTPILNGYIDDKGQACLLLGTQLS